MLDVDCPHILGMPFLRDVNPIIDWSTRCVKFVAPSSVCVATANSFAGLPVSSGECADVADCSADVAAPPADVAPSGPSPLPPTPVSAQLHGTRVCDPPARPGRRRKVSFDPTVVALSDCALVGGFVPCFDAAATCLSRGLRLAVISCSHCHHPVFDRTPASSSLPAERTCMSCLRTFACAPDVVGNPLASFMASTRAGARFLPGGGGAASGMHSGCADVSCHADVAHDISTFEQQCSAVDSIDDE